MRLLTDLYPYQRRGADKLEPSRVGALFMDMGSGKTRTAIDLVYRRRQRISRVVIFAPVSLKETWRQEIIKHVADHGGIYVFDDKTRMRTLDYGRFWYIIGIESVSQSDRVALAAHSLIDERTMVIVDESDKIKGHDALRTMRITHYSEPARYRLALTGTPLSQGVQDLYAQMRFLSPKILGYNSFYSFAANHLEYSDKYPGLIVRAHNTAWLAAKMSPYTYQITKEEAGLDLPPKLYDTRYFGLTWEQQAAYEQAKYEILMQIKDADEFDSYVIFQLFGALQQIVSGFWNRRREDGSMEHLVFPHPRVDTLTDAVEALPANEKVIIWSKFHYSIEQIVAALGERYGRGAVAEYHGHLNEAQRNAEIERWREDGRFLVATMGAGGRGLTLTEARYAIFYENEFKYAHRIQAEDRIHRIGQTQRPTYIDITSSSGIDQRIADALAKKQDAARNFRRQIETVKDRKDLVRRMIQEL